MSATTASGVWSSAEVAEEEEEEEEDEEGAEVVGCRCKEKSEAVREGAIVDGRHKSIAADANTITFPLCS